MLMDLYNLLIKFNSINLVTLISLLKKKVLILIKDCFILILLELHRHKMGIVYGCVLKVRDCCLGLL